MTMTRNQVGVTVDASHATYEKIIEEVLESAGLLTADGPLQYLARVILDFPLTWAIQRLERSDSIMRARTLVATQATHPVYLDCLASYHVAGVVTSTDEPAILSGVYAAATAQKTYQWRSGLTYMELRVTRLLLQGFDTRAAAAALSISSKTINAHVSNILCKLGYENRAQYVAHLLGSLSVEGTAEPAADATEPPANAAGQPRDGLDGDDVVARPGSAAPATADEDPAGV
jgi:DNA-binding CsgD family transcriptional regulator